MVVSLVCSFLAHPVEFYTVGPILYCNHLALWLQHTNELLLTHSLTYAANKQEVMMLTSSGTGESGSTAAAAGSSAFDSAIFCSSDNICAIFGPVQVQPVHSP